MSGGITLATGALIALERSKPTMRLRLTRAHGLGIRVTVPTVVLAEWWRAGFGARHQRLLDMLQLEPPSDRVAKAAGIALTDCPGASVTDAIVMASAALRGDVVITSDLADLSRLQRHFASVRVFGVGEA